MASLEPGTLYCDDNLVRLSSFPDESVDLVYLDPPFFSNRFYEVIWGDEAEVRSFEDRWEGGIGYYIAWMRQRLEEMHRVLKKDGSLYLHCDPHASHYLKVMADEVFGPGMFRSEVVWKRTGAHSGAKRWGPVHDVLLFYSKGRTFTWNPVYQPYSEEYVTEFNLEDEGGRYMDVSLTGPGERSGESGEPWRGIDPTTVGRHWQPSKMAYTVYEAMKGESLADLPMQERLDRMDEAGLIFWPKKKGGVPRFKQYMHYMPGLPAQDVITDVRPIAARAAERLGYPTQKPEALLERIIAASSDPGDMVLDPFCGCGTTVAVAERLGRQWAGIDISLTAIDIMERRLLKLGRAPSIVNAPSSVDALKRLKPFEFQNWAIGAINGTHSPRKTGDMGIDGYWFFTKDPVQVKQSEHVGRNVVDNFETAIRREGRDTGFIIAFSYTRGAHEEVARAHKDEGLTIHLVQAAEVLLLRRRRFMSVDIPGPQPDNVEDLPVPSMRKADDLPTLEELIESDTGTG